MNKNPLVNKLGLGTVQFGLKYGINNLRGQIPSKEVFEILDYATEVGINTLDTAYTYDESEDVIGEYISKSDKQFNIISKLPSKTDMTISVAIDRSLKKLHIKKLYGYLIHDFNKFRDNPQLISALIKIKNEGLIQKIGFSLYYPIELDTLLKEKVKFDMVQLPYNVFDQRFAPYFTILKEKNIEIHIRSVFLQGLVFKKPINLPKYFLPIRKHLEDLNKLADGLNVSISSLCLNFVLNNEFMDKVIIGVDSINNLKENLENLNDAEKVKRVMNRFFNLSFKDEKIILPVNWK